ncbi:MAG: hypothetical protein WB799_15105 [Candidatus Sulfotelmatobacter sp.]
MKLRVAWVIVGFLSLAVSLTPQTVAQTSTQTASALPRLVRFGGTVKDLNGSPLNGVVGITFALYSEPTGGAPLWLETQNATADGNGRYTVLLGSTKTEGLPADLFTLEQARWVGVQVSGQPEQPRVLLVSAPYALKAGDAETVGGLPPSAFVLAAAPAIGSATASSPAASAAAESVSPATTSDVTTTGGTLNTIPLFFTATSIQNSILTQTGTTAVSVGGKLNLPATGAATATAGKDSRPLDFVASSWSSTSGTAVNQTFQWQAEPAANDTASPSGTLNLLYGLGTAAPSETTLKLSSKGIFTFAAGQTFPGTGDGTVTSVATGLGLKGGPIKKTGTLTIDTTVVPQLAEANTFTSNQTVDGSLTSTGTVKAASLSATTATFSGSIGVNSTQEFPVEVTSSNSSVTSVYGIASSAMGNAWGVEGETASSASNAYGVFGDAGSSTGSPIGVYGFAESNTAIGVFGQNGTESTTGAGVISTFGLGGGGVFGDGGTASANWGVIGTADDGLAGWFENNSPSGSVTLRALALNRASLPFVAGYLDNLCSVDSGGNLNCTGTKNAVVPIDGGKRIVAMSAIEAPQNWFEDAGAAELVNGRAVVALDPDFIQTANTELDYKVFPVPNGDCKGLYVTNKTATSFEIRELGGGTSNIRFDYRIMALRNKYENVRFADHTHDLDGQKRMLARAHAAGTAHPQSHMPTKKLSLARPLIQATAAR